MSEEKDLCNEEVSCMNLDLARIPDTKVTTIVNTAALETNFSGNLYDLNTSDVSLKFGEVVFHSHQLILWAWSTKFQQQLQDLHPKSPSTGCDQLTLQLDLRHAEQDIAGTISDFLCFLYSGEVTLRKDRIWIMQDLASTYCISELQVLISEYLLNDLLVSSLSKEELLYFMTEAKRWRMFDIFNTFRKKMLFSYWVEELPPNFTVRVQNFPAYFLETFDDQSSSDVLIQTENREFHLHSFLLCLQSETFKELLQDHVTGKAYKLDEDLYCDNEESLEDVLKFIYSDTIDLDFTTAMLSINIAMKLQMITLVDVCVTFLNGYAVHVPLNDELVHCIKQTELLKMNSLHGTFYQILLANFFLYSDELLPTMSNDLLCNMLESSNLVAYNEYSLLCSLLPRLVELKDSDTKAYHKILNLVRFHQMSASEISELDFSLVMNDNVVMEAMLYRCSLWEETFTTLPSNLGPRLYLNPPMPYITIESFHDKPQVSIEKEYKMFFEYKLQTSKEEMSAYSYLLKQQTDGDPVTICQQNIDIDATWSHDGNRTLRFTVKFQREKDLDDDEDDDYGGKSYNLDDSDSTENNDVLLEATGAAVLYKEEKLISARMSKCHLKLETDRYGGQKLYGNQDMHFEFGFPDKTIIDDNETSIKLYMFTTPRNYAS